MKKLRFILSLLLAALCLNSCTLLNIPPNTPPSTGSNGSSVMFTRDGIDVVKNDPTLFYIPHQVNEVECVDSFTDGIYNYYCYYLGFLENFPLMYSSTIKHTGNGEQTYERTLITETQESIENSVSNSVSITNADYWENERGLEVGIEVKGGKALASIKQTFKGTWGEEHSQSTATETIHSVASTLAESSADAFQLHLTASDPIGEYRYVHYTKKAFVYAVVAYNKSSEQFSYDRVTFASDSVKDSVVMVEYSADGNFNSDNEETLIFDPSLIDSIDVHAPLENRAPSVDEPILPINIPVNRHLCRNDSNYNMNTSGNENDGHTDHDQYEIGHLTIYGCTAAGNVFNVEDSKSFAIDYVFEQRTDDLPNEYNNELRISDDDSSNVLGTEIKDQIHHGAYQIRILDDSGRLIYQNVQCDFMRNKDIGSVVSLVPGSIDCKEIGSIEITIVYELYYYYSWFDHHHTNWRCDYIFYFE